MKKGTMIENNINQTIASGINTAEPGVVFTLPRLVHAGCKWRSEGLPGIEFTPWPILMGGIAGAILGVVLIIPLRKQTDRPWIDCDFPPVWRLRPSFVRALRGWKKPSSLESDFW